MCRIHERGSVDRHHQQHFKGDGICKRRVAGGHYIGFGTPQRLWKWLGIFGHAPQRNGENTHLHTSHHQQH